MGIISAVQPVTVYSVVANTDLTEGRGMLQTIYVSTSRTTARRLAKGRGVQGCDAYVEESDAYQINGKLYVTGVDVKPNKADIESDKAIQAKIEKDEMKACVLKKLKMMGISEEEINLLKG